MKLQTSFYFDAAHRLVGYVGKCAQLHGHIWKVDITIRSTEPNQLDCNGILWDFTNVKQLADLFDHKTILKRCDKNLDIVRSIEKTCGDNSVYLMDENPTAENLVKEILGYLQTSNPDLCYQVKVWESPKSFAEDISFVTDFENENK